MVNAANKVNNSGEELTQKNFIKNTQLGEFDIDIFIRTGGDMRLSNFLLPNIGYSELFSLKNYGRNLTQKIFKKYSKNLKQDKGGSENEININFWFYRINWITSIRYY